MALLVVGIGDCKVSKDPSDVLVTHALGSCIAVVLYDPVARVAGLLHYMLPDSSLDPERAGKLPCVFADTGIPLLLEIAFRRGAAKSRIVIVAAGGAQMLDPTGTFNIGQRNQVAMQKILSETGLRIHKAEIGGTNSRTVRIDVASGRVQLRTQGQAERDMLAAGGNPCPL
jgi:chemotaxis protein CheD